MNQSDNSFGSTADENVAIGFHALAANTTGARNVAIGRYAIGTGVTTGSDNLCIGYNAGLTTTSASSNVAFGANSLTAVTTGGTNTALGRDAMSALTTSTNGSALGYQAAVTGSNQVQLGNASTTTYAYGAVQNRSDSRDKRDIRDTQLGLDFINKLRPVDFKWDLRDKYKPEMPTPLKSDATSEEKETHAEQMSQWLESVKLNNIESNGTHKGTRYHHGLIAQEVKSVIEEIGVDFGGYQDHSIKGGQDVLSIGYEELIAPLIKSVQELKAELDSLKAEIKILKGI